MASVQRSRQRVGSNARFSSSRSSRAQMMPASQPSPTMASGFTQASKSSALTAPSPLLHEPDEVDRCVAEGDPACVRRLRESGLGVPSVGALRIEAALSRDLQRGSLSHKLRHVNKHLAAVCDLGPWHRSPRNVKRSRGRLADAPPRDPLCPDCPPATLRRPWSLTRAPRTSATQGRVPNACRGVPEATARASSAANIRSVGPPPAITTA